MVAKNTPSQDMIHLFMGFIPARAIYVAAKLGIADALAEGPKSARELATETGVDADALHRVMRLLAGIGVFRQDEHDAFSLTPLGETLRRDSPDSVRDFVMLYHEIQYPSLVNALDSVRTGKPAFAKAFGKPIFEHLRADPEAGAIFQAGLRSRTRIDIPALLDAYDFSGPRRIVDVGGGSGALLFAILERYRHAAGVLFDLAPAVEAARSGLGAPPDRCEFVVGDFFETVPRGGDTYVLKLVLHDWSDDEAVRILKQCRSAIADGGRLLVIEGLIGAPNELSVTHYTDMIMLVSLTGVERTEREFASLLERGGFRLIRAIPTACDLFILEATPV